MSLPKWINGEDYYRDRSLLIKALEIAWEALEHGARGAWDTRKKLKEVMSRIEEMGK